MKIALRKGIAIAFAACALTSCRAERPESGGNTRAATGAREAAASPTFVAPSNIPAGIIGGINASKQEFVSELRRVIELDRECLLTLVDKKHSLPDGFAPADLMPLSDERAYARGRKDLSLRVSAEAALDEMARAARRDGVSLVASSSYRSYEYQKKVYARIVAEIGQAAADRESARPGTSQHQLGTAVDFGSITDDFALTKAGKWLASHAWEYGWSLSFPEGYESVTGYRWECWHYRYVGREAASLQRKWFGDVQQYMIEFVDSWTRGGY